MKNKELQITATRQAIRRSLADGQWHTFGELWGEYQKGGNPWDTPSTAMSFLSAMVALGEVQISTRTVVPQYRLPAFLS